MKNIRKMIALALLAAITGSLSAANYIIKNETDKTIYVNINKRMKKEPKQKAQERKKTQKIFKKKKNKTLDQEISKKMFGEKQAQKRTQKQQKLAQKQQKKLKKQQAKYLKRFKCKIKAGKSESIKRGGRDVRKIQVYMPALKLNAYYEGKVDIRRKGKDKTLIVKVVNNQIKIYGSGSKGLKCKTKTSSRVTKRTKKRKLIKARDQELIRGRDQSRKRDQRRKVIRARE